MDLYANNKAFEVFLDLLLKEVVLKQDNEIWIGEWFETVLDVFGGCMGRPSRLEMGLKAFRARRGTELTEEEKDWIEYLYVALKKAGKLSVSDSSESDSSDIHEATSSSYAGDNEGQGLV